MSKLGKDGRILRVSVDRVIQAINDYRPLRKLNEDEEELLGNIKDGLVVAIKMMKRYRNADEELGA